MTPLRPTTYPGQVHRTRTRVHALVSSTRPGALAKPYEREPRCAYGLGRLRRCASRRTDPIDRFARRFSVDPRREPKRAGVSLADFDTVTSSPADERKVLPHPGRIRDVGRQRKDVTASITRGCLGTHVRSLSLRGPKTHCFSGREVDLSVRRWEAWGSRLILSARWATGLKVLA